MQACLKAMNTRCQHGRLHTCFVYCLACTLVYALVYPSQALSKLLEKFADAGKCALFAMQNVCSDVYLAIGLHDLHLRCSLFSSLV